MRAIVLWEKVAMEKEKMELNGENSVPPTSLPVDRLNSGACNADTRANIFVRHPRTYSSRQFIIQTGGHQAGQFSLVWWSTKKFRIMKYPHEQGTASISSLKIPDFFPSKNRIFTLIAIFAIFLRACWFILYFSHFFVRRFLKEFFFAFYREVNLYKLFSLTSVRPISYRKSDTMWASSSPLRVSMEMFFSTSAVLLALLITVPWAQLVFPSATPCNEWQTSDGEIQHDLNSTKSKKTSLYFYN